MPTAKLQGRGYSTTPGGGLEYTERFRVDADANTTTISLPSLGISTEGQTLSNGTTVRRVTIDEFTAGISDVVVQASNASASSLTPEPAPDQTDPSRFVWGSSGIAIEIRVPYVTAEPYQYVNVSGATIPLSVFAPNEDVVTDNGVIVDLEVNTGPITPDQFQAVGVQRNKIHTIGSQQLKYINGQTRQISNDTWLINHQWMIDPGTIQINGDGVSVRWPGDGLNIVTVPGSDPPPTGFLRAPFHALKYRPATTVNTPGDVLHYRVGDLEPDGWLTLPGVLP